jgi:hypothetical protein
MKLPRLSPLQVITIKRLAALSAGYFLGGMAMGSLAGAGWILAGAIGAGAALIRVAYEMFMEYARNGKLAERQIDKIIKKQVDAAPGNEDDKKPNTQK